MNNLLFVLVISFCYFLDEYQMEDEEHLPALPDSDPEYKYVGGLVVNLPASEDYTNHTVQGPKDKKQTCKDECQRIFKDKTVTKVIDAPNHTCTCEVETSLIEKK